MHYNALGSFVGLVNSQDIKPRPNIAKDTRSLWHHVFFAAPLLAGTFVKYSGSKTAGHNGDVGFGAAIDAFAHHVVVETGGNALLCDLQGKYDPLLNSSVN